MVVIFKWHFHEVQNQSPGEPWEHHLGEVLQGRSKSKFNITLSFLIDLVFKNISIGHFQTSWSSCFGLFSGSTRWRILFKSFRFYSLGKHDGEYCLNVFGLIPGQTRWRILFKRFRFYSLGKQDGEYCLNIFGFIPWANKMANIV